MRKFLGLVCMALAVNPLLATEKVVVEDEAKLDNYSNLPQNGELEVRTFEDQKQGKENVINVINELKTLFSKNTYSSLNDIKQTPIAPAYNKVVTNIDGTSTLVYRPRFTNAEEISKSLNVLASKTSNIKELEESNIVLINDKNDYMTYYKDLIDVIDTPSAQILIEAKVVEVSFSDGMQRNLSMGFSDGSSSTSSTTSAPGSTSTNGLNGEFTPGNFDISFNWLLTAEDAKVISSPNILISKNEVARIVTAEEIPIQEATTVSDSLNFTTTYKRVGVTLEVEPQMINDDNVTLRLYPQVSSVLSYEEFNASDGTAYTVPVVSIRSIESYLRMHDQQVVMLGGLYMSSDTLSQERIPVLSDIPLIGEIFTGKTKLREIVQLIFFIKIHIIPPEKASNDFMYNPEAQAIQNEGIISAINNPNIIPEHEKGVVSLYDEMVDSLDDSWIGEKNAEEKKEETFIETQETIKD